MGVCEPCAMGKIKQTPIGKLPMEDNVEKGTKIGMDSSGMKGKSLAGNKVWNLKLDCGTDNVWSAFMKKKSDVPDDGKKLVKHIRNEVGEVQITFGMDNAGENKKFEEKCMEDNSNVSFECMAPNTPQQNARVE